MNTTFFTRASAAALFLAFGSLASFAEDKKDPKENVRKEVEVSKEAIEGKGDGWTDLGEADFYNVNTKEDTWKWKEGVLYCTGHPIGVLGSKKEYGNFEMVVDWRHMAKGGNSGVFVWAPDEVLKTLKPNSYPRGIEVQILDHGYAEQYEKSSGKKATWFTTNGDMFPVGGAKFHPYPPVSPDGSRSFPRKNLSKGVGEWNHYYIRGQDGDLRLWVNGEEVSGGNEIKPASGHICLESEGAPIEFKNIRIRAPK